MRKKKKLLFFLCVMGFVCNAQIVTSIRVIPNISIGYTFGYGVNCSFGCGVSLIDYKIADVPVYSGLEFSYALFTHKRELYENGFYRVVSINLMNIVNEMMILKLGMAKTKLKWGVRSVNTSYSRGWGINVDVAFKPYYYSPHLGFRYFRINNVCMGIGQTNPKFLYVGYQFPFVIYNDESTVQ
jgi:hypothetical protein